MNKIITWFAYPPIPDRSNDWAAYRENDVEDSSHYAWGRTEWAAVQNLLQQEMDERVEAEATDKEVGV